MNALAVDLDRRDVLGVYVGVVVALIDLEVRNFTSSNNSASRELE